MTKTFTIAVLNRLVGPDLQTIMLINNNEYRSIVWSAAGGWVIGICLRFGFLVLVVFIYLIVQVC